MIRNAMVHAFGCALVAAAMIAAAPATAQTSKPNVVFILADNVGYVDMGPFATLSIPLGAGH